MRRLIVIALWCLLFGLMAWVAGASVFGILAHMFSKPGQDLHTRELWNQVFYALAFGLPGAVIITTVLLGVGGKLPGTTRPAKPPCE